MAVQRDFGTDRVLVPGKLRGFKYLLVQRSQLRSINFRNDWTDGVLVADCPIYQAKDVISDCTLCSEKLELTQQEVKHAEMFTGGVIKVIRFCTHTVRHREIVVKATNLHPSHEEPAPGKDCTCGFYAAYTLSDLVGSPGTSWCFGTRVLAVVEASGRIIMGTKGFRAEKMRVVAIENMYWEEKHKPYFLPNTVIFDSWISEPPSHFNNIPMFYTSELTYKFPPDDISGLLGESNVEPT